jgi:valyl-tRNA synthetase
MREIGKYTPGDIESKWYGHWLENNYFHAEVSEKSPIPLSFLPLTLRVNCTWDTC